MRAKESAECWICLESASESGEHLCFTGCACMNYVHVSCGSTWVRQRTHRILQSPVFAKQTRYRCDVCGELYSRTTSTILLGLIQSAAHNTSIFEGDLSLVQPRMRSFYMQRPSALAALCHENTSLSCSTLLSASLRAHAFALQSAGSFFDVLKGAERLHRELSVISDFALVSGLPSVREKA